MPNKADRKRPIQVKFFVDEKELGLIKARMAQLGIENMSAYLRKMAIDRYAAKPDLLALFCKEILVAPRRISQVHIHLLCLLFSVPHVSKRHLPNGNRRQPPPCLTKSETDGRKSMAARRTVKSRFISPILTLCQGQATPRRCP